MGEETIALNRRARHQYTIDDTFEAGIALTGTEIKSIREHKVNLSDAYARIDRGEMWLFGAHIAPYEAGNRLNHEAKRTRKLQMCIRDSPGAAQLRAHERRPSRTGVR